VTGARAVQIIITTTTTITITNCLHSRGRVGIVTHLERVVWQLLLFSTLATTPPLGSDVAVAIVAAVAVCAAALRIHCVFHTARAAAQIG